MAITNHWIYQKRETATPRAFYVVKEYDKHFGKRADVLDVTFYHESIKNATHIISKVGMHYETVSGYVDELLSIIGDYASITNDDIQQLTVEIQDILI